MKFEGQIHSATNPLRLINQSIMGEDTLKIPDFKTFTLLCVEGVASSERELSKSSQDTPNALAIQLCKQLPTSDTELQTTVMEYNPMHVT